MIVKVTNITDDENNHTDYGDWWRNGDSVENRKKRDNDKKDNYDDEMMAMNI